MTYSSLESEPDMLNKQQLLTNLGTFHQRTA
jgi:hypothetical protein